MYRKRFSPLSCGWVGGVCLGVTVCVNCGKVGIHERYGGLKMEENAVAVIDVFTYKGYIDVYHADACVYNRTRGR